MPRTLSIWQVHSSRPGISFLMARDGHRVLARDFEVKRPVLCMPNGRPRTVGALDDTLSIGAGGLGLMDVGIQVLVLMWIVFLAVAIQWGRTANRGASVATWLGLTIVTWWFELIFAFFAIHAVLFEVGREAAQILGIAVIAIISMTPVAWAYGLRYWNRHRSAQ